MFRLPLSLLASVPALVALSGPLPAHQLPEPPRIGVDYGRGRNGLKPSTDPTNGYRRNRKKLLKHLRETAKRRAAVDALTNYERNQWAKSGYKGDPLRFKGCRAQRAA